MNQLWYGVFLFFAYVKNLGAIEVLLSNDLDYHVALSQKLLFTCLDQ